MIAFHVRWYNSYAMLSLEEIKKRLLILKKYKSIHKVILYGSYAKGDISCKSDLDFIVIMDTNKRFFDRYDLCDLFYDLFDIHLDILPYTEEEFKRISHRPFIKSIIEEGIIVYESPKKHGRSKTLATHGSG